MLVNEMRDVIRDYRRLRAVVPPGSVRTKNEYDRAVQLLDEIVDDIGEDEKYPLAELADAVSVFIEKYEAQHAQVPQARPTAVLRFLMRGHDLRQSDLPEIGSQGVVSEVLAGTRELNARPIKGLAKRLRVSSGVYREVISREFLP